MKDVRPCAVSGLLEAGEASKGRPRAAVRDSRGGSAMTRVRDRDRAASSSKGDQFAGRRRCEEIMEREL